MSPFSMRLFEGPISQGPYSQGPLSDGSLLEAPLSMRIAKVSGDAGPGYRMREGEEVLRVTRTDKSTGTSYQIARLSPAALWFLTSDSLEYQRDEVARVSVSGQGSEIGPILGQVISVEPAAQEGATLVGLHLTGVTQSVGRKLLMLLHQLVRARLAEPARSLSMLQELINDRERLTVLMQAFLAAGGKGVLRGVDVPVTATGFDPDGEGRVSWVGLADWGEPPFVVDVAGYNSIQKFYFTSAASAFVEGGGAAVTTPLPTHVERVRHRWFRRCAVRSSMSVRFVHPLWPELYVTHRKVKDISYAGLSFETDLEQDLGFPGLELPELILEAEGKEPIRLRGQMRFVSQAKDESPPLCGMKVAPSSPAEESKWRQLISEELHATTQSGVGHSETVWSLFESSGYFNLSGKTPDQFETLKKSFIALGHRATDAPELFCQAVWPSGRGIEASVSLIKAYEGSWLGHQLAKRAGKAPGNVNPRHILRDIYIRAFEHPQADPDFRWAIAYLEAQVPWSQKSHIEFAQRYDGTGLTMVAPFRLMEGTSSEMCEIPDEFASHSIDIATPDEKDQLAATIAQIRPAIYLEALDFVPDRFDIDMVRRAWAQTGIERQREVLIARRGGAAVAAAVVETGETGTNLFRLLDGVRLFSLARGGEEACVALLNETRAWYASKGKQTFTYFNEYEDDSHTVHSKLRGLGTGNFWIISAILLPDFLEHVYELTASRRNK